MGVWSNSLEKVWDGFLKATGAALVAVVGAVGLWGYNTLGPFKRNTQEEFYLSSYVPDKGEDDGWGHVDDWWLGSSKAPAKPRSLNR